MTPKTIAQLNQLNHQFYQQIADDFSDSRNYYWHGWEKLLPHLVKILETKAKISVLDLGCGNGRFGQFLAEKIGSDKVEYYGVDFSAKLLALAKERLAKTKLETTLLEADIVQLLLEESTPTRQLDKTYDAVVAFGLLHHIPSLKLRHQLFADAHALLAKDGLFGVAAWQFINSPRLAKKVVNPTTVGLRANELEDNDYILDWLRGSQAYRYTHFTTEAELTKLTDANKWETVTHYLADGKEGNINQYLVLKKN